MGDKPSHIFMMKTMMRVLQNYSLLLLGLGLPLHGILTVFTPEPFRWWKELVLFLLMLTVFLAFYKSFKFKPFFLTEMSRSPKALFLALLRNPAMWALLILGWGALLVLLNLDFYTSLMAYRYLTFGFFAFVLGYGLWRTPLFSGKNGYKFGLQLFHNFCTGLLYGVLLSTVLGVWAKFAGGFSVLNQWYSQTISSWVPGQTVPIYHQVGDFIRLQGGSSGPVEYGHLAVLALWYTLGFKNEVNRLPYWSRPVVVAFLLFGIFQSGSRAALLGAFILLGGFAWLKFASRVKLPPVKWTVDKLAALLLVFIVLTVMVKFTLNKSVLGASDFMNNNFVRLSDIDHINRPIEAFKVALESPLWGNLGSLGPAARAKNLAENNNDYALIAESVPFDVLAQLGFVGLGLWLLFFVTAWCQGSVKLRLLMLSFAPLILLATIFDMTPVSISFFLILGLGLIFPSISKAKPSDFLAVFDLKKQAFRAYVNQVWGWQEPEQEKFVAQELEQGGVHIIRFENRIIGTYALVDSSEACQVYSFYIYPDYQSLGIGSFMLNQIFPAKVLCLQVLKVNSLAKAFYESHGFQVVGEDEHHWHLKRLP